MQTQTNTATKRKSTYVPTGWSRGRPRKGEIRPVTPGGAAQAQYRAKCKSEDPEGYRAAQAIYQQLWREENYERSLEIKRAAARRARLWAGCKIKVAG